MSLQMHIVGPAHGHNHSHTVIILHGRDSDASEFASEFFECEVSSPDADRTLPALFPTVRWVFPQAEKIPSERFGTDMSQWFDMWSVEEPQQRPDIQAPGLRASIDHLAQIIKDEEGLVSRDHIFVAGISQGFATAIATVLADGRGGLAGLCGFCSWIPLIEGVRSAARIADPSHKLRMVQQHYLGRTLDIQEKTLRQGLLQTPILLEHSRDDTVIPVSNGQYICQVLKELGFSAVEWHEYEDGGHWFNEPQGVDEFAAFLRRGMSAR